MSGLDISIISKRNLKSNLVLFTKWDRFSRNAGDAYQMIKLLLNNNISPQAMGTAIGYVDTGKQNDACHLFSCTRGRK